VLRSLQDVCKELAVDYSLELLDVLEDPKAAERYRVLTTPMLMRVDPETIKRILGELTDSAALARALDLGTARPL
jgi:circadian clock protein KaiB